MGNDKGSLVIVGFGSGISNAVAEVFGREGHPLVLIARSAEKIAESARRLNATGLKAVGLTTDAGDAAAMREAMNEARKSFGDPEVLLYNAATWRPGPVLQISPEQLDGDFHVCVTGALIAVRELVPAMIAHGRGSLLFTGGGLALRPSPQAPSLSIGKAGIRAMALMLAEELAPKSIRVGTVTVAGPVAPNTPFSPEKIASAFWKLHRSNPDPTTAEIIFSGA